MKRLVLALIVLLALIVAGVVFWPFGNGGGPEPIAYGRDACARCRMILSQPGFAGELRDAKGAVAKYDDLGCLLVAMAAAEGGRPAAWVEDHAGGGLVPVRGATLVEAPQVATPMGYGIVAFKDGGAAKAFAESHQGALVKLETLLADQHRFGHGGTAGSGGGELGAWAEAKPGGPRPFDEAMAMAGKPLFVRECSACHGERGDGKGLAAPFLDPRPRNFMTAMFRLRTTESGQPPRTRDIVRTIEHGIPGSSMPSFAFLTRDEQAKIAAYVLRVADFNEQPEPEPIADPGTAPPPTPETIARGMALYTQLQCGKCHGDLGKGDGPSAAALKDDQEQPIKVRDFTDGVFRGGSERKDLYYRFMTGMDGTPMPSFASVVGGTDAWALIDYVMSLKVPMAEAPLPADPIQAGRQVAAKYSCRGCHMLDDGVGGDVGPDLRVSAQKLGSEWVRTFLKAPRDYGKIYPFRVSRMPDLKLTAEEIEVMTRYLAAVGKRRDEPLAVPDVTQFPPERVAEGKNFFILRCTECHNLGTVIETPPAKQQGPDLARVANRVDYEWTKRFVTDPKKIDPKSRMVVPGLTPDQIDAVRMFIWKTSVESGAGKTVAAAD